jgi:hypothetical protein
MHKHIKKIVLAELESALDIKGSSMSAGAARKAQQSRARETGGGGVTPAEMGLIDQIETLLSDAARDGNIATGKVLQRLQLAMAEVKKLVQSGDTETEV